MLAFDDQALARIVIAATAVPPRRRRQWLADIAMRLEGVTPAAPSARRTRQWRDRRRDGRMVVRIEVGEPEVEALVALGLLGSHLADEREAVADAVARLLRVLPTMPTP